MSARISRELAKWEETERAAEFPYESIMSCFRTYGKHFVPHSVLQALASTRAKLSPAVKGDAERALLDKFLDIALDKWDGRYSYLTYLGIDLLDLVPGADPATGRRQSEEWVALLLADVWAFEIEAHERRNGLLPLLRPGAELVEKRIHLLATALSTMSAPGVAMSESVDRIGDAARRLRESVPPDRRRALYLSMQPVYVVHDEYLFIRVLQSFEVTFAAMSAEIRGAIDAVRGKRAEEAAAGITRCSRSLDAARRLFTLLATMSAQSFRVFRTYTVGASAIQSECYKTFEALCSFPSDARIRSPAFESVPRVRDRVRHSWDNLTSVVADSVSRGLIDAESLDLVSTATRELERVHQHWKQTHWKMAVRMIGEERGTGYTVGVPYLKDAIGNRLFTRPLGENGGELCVEPARR